MRRGRKAAGRRRALGRCVRSRWRGSASCTWSSTAGAPPPAAPRGLCASPRRAALWEIRELLAAPIRELLAAPIRELLAAPVEGWFAPRRPAPRAPLQRPARRERDARRGLRRQRARARAGLLRGQLQSAAPGAERQERPPRRRAPPPPTHPPPRTKWTRRVPHPVLIGHVRATSAGVPPAWPRAQAEALHALWQGSATPRADSARLPSPRAGEAALAGRAQVA